MANRIAEGDPLGRSRGASDERGRMPFRANAGAALAVGSCRLAVAARAQTIESCYRTRQEVEAATGAQLREGSPLERAQPNGSAVCTFALRRGRDPNYR